MIVNKPDSDCKDSDPDHQIKSVKLNKQLKKLYNFFACLPSCIYKSYNRSSTTLSSGQNFIT